MVLASLNGQLIVKDTDDTVHDTDLLLLTFKHRSLFDMQLYDRSNIVTFRAFQRFRLVPGRYQCFTKCDTITAELLEILLFQRTTDRTAPLTAGSESTALFLHQTDHFQAVLRNVARLFEVSQRGYTGHNAQCAIIFSTVLYSIQVGSRQYGAWLCPWKPPIHVSDRILSVFKAQIFDPLTQDVLRDSVLRGIRCTPDFSVDTCRIGQLAQHLFYSQSGFVSHHKCPLILSFVFYQYSFVFFPCAISRCAISNSS